MRYKLKCLLYSLTTLFLTFGCIFNKEIKTYKVVLEMLPEKIDPHNNEINIFNYINSHLFYPLFIKKNNKLQSYYLDIEKCKTNNLNFDTFTLCLKDNVSYRITIITKEKR